jgi:hypothetical protein
MELSDVLTMLRVDLDDLVKEYLWSDEILIGYIDQGYKEFARITRVLTDQSTAGLAETPVTANDSWVTLDPRVLEVRRAYLVTAGVELSKANFNQAPMKETFSRPSCFVSDQVQNQLRLIPGPTENDTLCMNVVRLPLEDLEESPDLEFHDRRYWQVVNAFAAALAWRNPDVDTFDTNRAAEAEARFYERAEEIRVEIENRTRTPGTVSYGGIVDAAQTYSDY